MSLYLTHLSPQIQLAYLSAGDTVSRVADFSGKVELHKGGKTVSAGRC